MAFEPDLRIGDRERDAVAAELQEHFARGRLTLEEFNQRIDAVFAAKTQADLSRLTSDLPHVRSWGSLPSSSAPRSRPRGTGGGAMATAWTPAPAWTDAPAWAGPDPRPGTGHSHGPRGGFALLATLMALFASWFLVYDVILTGLRVPLPGRLGLLIAIYTLIRALLRRIFRRRR